jgi:hypothetical protein
MTMQELLAPGRFVDSDAPSIKALAHRVTAGLRDEIERIVRLYRAVRDTIVYDPYVDFFDQQNYRVSSVLAPVAVFASASRQCWPLLLGQSVFRRGSAMPMCVIT